MASKVLKATTGLTGMEVCQNPHEKLVHLYGRVLRALEKLPQEAAYRRHAEKITKDRLAAVKKSPGVEDIEKNIKCGQVEELIIQANNEYHLAKRMAKWKAWEPLIAEAPPNQWTWPPHQ